MKRSHMVASKSERLFFFFGKLKLLRPRLVKCTILNYRQCQLTMPIK